MKKEKTNQERLFINRELSWLEFNRRVLEVAKESQLPLLERVKFLAITASNLDEFLQVRIGSLHVLISQGRTEDKDESGLTTLEQLYLLRHEIHTFMQEMYEVYFAIEIKLRESGIFLEESLALLNRTEHHFVEQYVRENLRSVITPMPLVEDPLPILKNLGLYFFVNIESAETPYYLLPLYATNRFVDIPEAKRDFHLRVETIVKAHINTWFPQQKVLHVGLFRLTKNADFVVRENELSNLVLGMEEVLIKRQLASPVRLEIEAQMDEPLIQKLCSVFEVNEQDVIRMSGPIDMGALFYIANLPNHEDLQITQWSTIYPSSLPANESIFDLIAHQDHLLIHPYESFDSVERFVSEAADDDQVLAIKQVLYRSGKKSKLIDALIRASERGKSVTVIVELKARFDEERNIDWAQKLERNGVQVIYGIANYKTHAKICMVVRREPNRIVKYLHFATGNYNATTAKLYSDVGFFTCAPEFGEDATLFFNTICGLTTPQHMQKLSMAPLTLRKTLEDLIDRATGSAQSGTKAHLDVKINSLCDPNLIEKLYKASQAGVKIRLNVRGICMLRPGVKMLSENITVCSVIDRYLEHARIIHLTIGKEEQLFISSADWMPRNLNRRIELLIPIESSVLRKKLIDFLNLFFKDNTHAWLLESTGVWQRKEATATTAFSAQHEAQRYLELIEDEQQKKVAIQFKPHRRTIK